MISPFLQHENNIDFDSIPTLQQERSKRRLTHNGTDLARQIYNNEDDFSQFMSATGRTGRVKLDKNIVNAWKDMRSKEKHHKQQVVVMMRTKTHEALLNAEQAFRKFEFARRSFESELKSL